MNKNLDVRVGGIMAELPWADKATAPDGSLALIARAEHDAGFQSGRFG